MSKIVTFFRQHFLLFLFLALSIPLLSYRLLQVPTGLTVDEAAFAYNATLLSKTLHDENGRFLPLFVLSIEGKDWRQPLTQYYQTFFFKLFGATVYNLRFSSVILTLISAFLLYILIDLFLESKILSLLSLPLFLTIPIVFIQSHYGLDNNMTLPFTILWLIGLFQFTKTKKSSWLLFSAFSLGIAFYTYKGMRAVVPVWTALTCFYLWRQYSFKSAFKFGLFILPFFAIIPLLQVKYPGAVFNGQRPSLMTYYDFFYPYISTFDPGFLFITGDSTPFHSTSHHGMFLLATLPFFIAGIYTCLRQKNHFYHFILLSFFSTPVLMGFVESVHRASRLMCLIPAFVFLSLLGIQYLWSQKFFLSHSLAIILLILILFNFTDFFNFYHHDYAKVTENIFGKLDYYQSFEFLQKESRSLNLKPAISQDLLNSFGETGKFYEAAYIPSYLQKYPSDALYPTDILLMSDRENIPGLTQVAHFQNYFFHRAN